MKEKEQGELTIKPVNPTLNDERNIYMAEPGGGDIPQGSQENASSGKQEKKPDIRGAVIREGLRRSVFGKSSGDEKPQETQERSRKAWEEFYKDKKMLPGEKSVVEAIIREGGIPKGWVDKDVPVSEESSNKEEANIDEVNVEDASPEPFVAGGKSEPESEKEFVPGDLQGFKKYFKDTLHDATEEQIEDISKGALENVKRREAGELPNSFEELIALVMKFQEVEWKPGGEHELIDKEGRVVKENFIAWVRKRMVDLHEFNPTTSVNFFSDINVKAGYSVISFYDMIFTGSYFMEKKYQPNADISKDGKVSLDTQSELFQNEDYKAMKDQLITEAFLFQNSRNNHITYMQNMHSESELPKLLNQIYYANPFTRGKYLEKVLTMPSMDKAKIQKLRDEFGIIDILEGDTDEVKAEKQKKISEFQDRKIDNLIKNETEVGEGVREALLAYYYINDPKMLEQILGEDSVLFQEKYLEYDSTTGKPAREQDGTLKKSLIGKANDEKKEKDNSRTIKKENYVKYDPQTGKLIRSSENIENFTKYINVFNDATKDERIVSEVRERIIQTLVNKLGINYSEAKYAEAWAYSMTRWTGIGARNDVNAVGFDAWSKTQNFMEYRLKQMEEKRAGVVGNIYNLLGIKRASLSFLEGVTDVHGRTVIEAIQGGQGHEIKKYNPFKKQGRTENNTTEDKNSSLGIEFSQDVSQRFAANHITNSFGIYDFVINHHEFNLEEMVTYDAVGRPIIDQKKANEIIDGIQKQIRYAYSTWGGTDYSKNIRVYESRKVETEDGHGVKKLKKAIIAEDKPIIAAMFGPEILRFIKEDMDRKGILRDEDKAPNIYRVGEGKSSFEIDVARIQSDDNKEREILWKHVMKYLIGQEIKSHRTVHSDLSRYSYATTQRVYSFLRSKGIVTEEDIQDMRRLSNTSQKRMFTEEFALEFGKGGAKGIWDAFKFFAAHIAD